jgi:hypothetical protein
MQHYKGGITLEPYQIMCLICQTGGKEVKKSNMTFEKILEKIRRNPDIPITLRCNVSSVYAFQNPLKENISEEGELHKKRRNLYILQRLGLVPGATRPARQILNRLLKNITTSIEICGHEEGCLSAWKGCPYWQSGNYEAGRASGIVSIIQPRTEKEKLETKETSAKRILEAKKLLIRPHHLLCMACFYGNNMDKFEPVQEDNLYEVIKVIQANPTFPITLVEGCCMICSPCSSYDPGKNICFGDESMSLRDEKKDLDVLQKLNLQYGDTLPAQKIFELIFKRICSTKEICGWGDGYVRAPEWSICGCSSKYPLAEYSEDEPYNKGRQHRLDIKTPNQ